MSKCSKCLISEQMRLSDEPCTCAWFMDNIIIGGDKSTDSCDIFIEVKKCKPVRNMAVTSEHFTGNKFYQEDNEYPYIIKNNRYRIFTDNQYTTYIDFSELAFKEYFINIED